MKTNHYLSNERYIAELGAFKICPKKVTLTIAVENGTKAIKEIIAYDKQSNKSAMLSIINYMYWNGEIHNGIEIANKHKFIIIQNKNDFDNFYNNYNLIKYYLESPFIQKRNKILCFYEDRIYDTSKVYNS